MRKILFAIFALSLSLWGQTVNQDILPATTGLSLGNTNQQWDGFFRNITIAGTCNGCGSGGGGGGNLVVFQTNGTPNGSQILFNLFAGSGITLSENGAGTITITAPQQVSLRTNGVANGSQSVMNLKAGTNVTLADDGVGGVTITAAGGGGGGPALQTNGVSNGSQALLNLIPGAGITLVDNGTGGVTVTNTGANGVSLAPAATQNIVNKPGVDTTSNSFNNVKYVNDTSSTHNSYNWQQTITDDLSVSGSKTIHLTPCPVGIDVTNNANAPYYVYISATGTAEAVPVTGGTCTSGGTTGTIVVTTANAHSASSNTIGSASTGIQEAINDAGTPNPKVVIPPSNGSGNPTYVVRATVYFHSNKGLLEGYGAFIQCFTRDVCIFNGDRASSWQSSKIRGIRLVSAVNVDGVQIINAGIGGGIATIQTGSAHNLLTGDYVFVQWYTTNNSQAGVFKITVTDSTHFTYASSGTFGAAAAFGHAAIEAAAIENGTLGESQVDDVLFSSAGAGSNKFHFGIVNDNDQSFVINHISNEAGGALRCDAGFCGAEVFQRGDQGNAGIIYLRGSELSMQCSANGVLNLAGNNMSIKDSVIQGFPQYGTYYANGLQGLEVDNTYNEVGNCNNPYYPTSVQSAAGIIQLGNRVELKGGAPTDGALPLMANTGSTQRNYFIVPHSATFGYGPMMLGAKALTNMAGSITVYWPQLPGTGAGAIVYDVLYTTGSLGNLTIAPYLGNALSLDIGDTGSCTNGICSFTYTEGNPPAASAAYTVNNQTWTPTIAFWPGKVVLSPSFDSSNGSNSATLSTSSSPLGNIIAAQGYKVPSVYAVGCSGAVSWSPIWVSCISGEKSAPGIYATVLDQKDFSGNGPFVNSKGRLNLGPQNNNLPGHLITLSDSNFAKTAASPGMRPSNDANDSFVGLDQAGGMSMGSQTSYSQYIGNVGDGTNWLYRLTSALANFKVNTTVTGNLATSGTFNMTAAGTLNIEGSFGGTCNNSSSGTKTNICFDTSGKLSTSEATNTPVVVLRRGEVDANRDFGAQVAAAVNTVPIGDAATGALDQTRVYKNLQTTSATGTFASSCTTDFNNLITFTGAGGTYPLPVGCAVGFTVFIQNINATADVISRVTGKNINGNAINVSVSKGRIVQCWADGADNYQCTQPVVSGTGVSVTSNQNSLNVNLNHGTVINGMCQGTIGAANTTAYVLLPWKKANALTCADATVQEAPIPYAGTFQNLFASQGSAGATSSSCAVTLYSGNSAQAITIALGTSNATTVVSDTTHTLHVTAGTLYSLRVVTNQASDTCADIRASIEFIPD